MNLSEHSILNNIFFPRKISTKDSKDFLIQIDSEVKINARFFLKDSSLPNILFYHGNAEIANDYNDISTIYNNYGFNFIAIEYRGYGLSSGQPSINTFNDDCVYTFDSVCCQLKKINYTGNTLVMGRSLGSAAVCSILRKRSSSINACIIESGFANEDFFFNIIKETQSTSDTFGNLEAVKKYNKPLLIIHSIHDHIVPFKQAELLYNSAKTKDKQLYSIDNANHNNIILVEKEKYFDTIKTFYETTL